MGDWCLDKLVQAFLDFGGIPTNLRKERPRRLFPNLPAIEVVVPELPIAKLPGSSQEPRHKVAVQLIHSPLPHFERHTVVCPVPDELGRGRAGDSPNWGPIPVRPAHAVLSFLLFQDIPGKDFWIATFSINAVRTVLGGKNAEFESGDQHFLDRDDLVRGPFSDSIVIRDGA